MVVTITWLPGAEAWMLIESGTYSFKRPGWTTLVDVVLHLAGYGQGNPVE